jgi:hypothetical protein
MKCMLVMAALAALAALAVAPSVAPAKDLETTHLFGFTLGSDVNAVGEREAESEATGRFAKRSGAYTAIDQAFAVKFTPFQDFSIEPGAGIAFHGISGVPGLDDTHQWAFDTASLELRYRLLNRATAPFGLTLGADPQWGRVDDVSGAPVDRFGAEFRVMADKELVADRLFGAVNLLYAPEASRSRVTGATERQSTLGVSAALTGEVQPRTFIGGEVRYLRSYDGLELATSSGHALFAGPTFYRKLSDCCWVSAAWSIQVMGSATAQSGVLDLVNFERHQAKLRFGYNF